MKSIPGLCCCLLLAFLTGSCKKIWTLERMDPGCPSATALQPAEGAPFDAIVTVTGQNFLAGHPELHLIQIGDSIFPPGVVTEVSNETTLRFRVPKGMPCGKVRVRLVDDIGCTGSVDDGPYFTYHYTAMAAVTTGCTDCFSAPQGLDIEQGTGSVFIADKGHHNIKAIAYTGNGDSTNVIAGSEQNLLGNTSDPNNGLLSKFRNPTDVAVDNYGNIYVADTGNHRIRKIDNSTNRGVTLISGLSSGGADDTKLLDARYRKPVGIATNGTDKLFVVENDGHRLRQIELDQDTVFTLFGSLNATPSGNGLNFPTGVAYDTIRNAGYPVYVADNENHIVRAIANLTDHQKVLGDTVFVRPYAIAADNKGNLYVADRDQKKICIVYPNGSYNWLTSVGELSSVKTLAGIAVDWKRKYIYVSDETQQIIIRIALE